MQTSSLWFLVVATATAVAAVEATCAGPTVTTKQGQICGITTPDYHKFLGIPYAEPPVGQLRWKDSVPKRPWQGVRQCTAECNKCVQAILVTPLTEGHENCLCLNVYVPKKPESKSLSVMVWIHGGAFVMGSGNSDMYNPVHLVAKGVIVVTLNYRLGTLGFLNLGSEEAPGNQGLKDQVLALLWVRDNIQRFGGNPNDVTIFGESAGAVSVHLHTLSPMSIGLFAKAIAQSGSALNLWGFNVTTACSNALLLQDTKCPPPRGNDTAATVACLRALPAAALQAPIAKYVCKDNDRSGGMLAFYPSLDGKFLTDEPIKLAALCKIVPMLVGYNSGEGIISLTAVRLNNEYDLWTNNIQTGVGMDQVGTNCTADAARLAQWGARAKQHFLGGRALSVLNEQPFVKYVTFFSFVWGINLGINIRVSCPLAPPQYLYLFDANTILNHAKQISLAFNLKGAAHADELAYIFQFAIDKLPPMLMPRDAQMVHQRLVTMWTNFAKFGNPTPKTDNRIITTEWKPYTYQKRNYLLIDNTGMHDLNNPFESDCNFFEDLIDKCE